MSNKTEVTDHFAAMVSKSMEIMQLKAGLMNLLLAEERNEELINDVRSDLDVARDDFMDMLDEFTGSMEEYYERENKSGSLGETSC